MVLAPVSSRIPCLPRPYNTLERSLLLITEEIKGNLKAVRVQKRSKESPSKSERYEKKLRRHRRTTRERCCGGLLVRECVIKVEETKKLKWI